ncbi:MAG: glutathione S-transferase N-terminal domain-containing protein [Lautropia sp.]|nr:glutathione S-transferase N-terminal domain-containing protein [Lautropia sp.]
MKLYVSPTSPYGRICLTRALLLGLDDLPLQIVDPWQNPPELEAINPLSQIPVLLLDDRTPLPGTLSICQYLAGQRPSTQELATTSQALALLDTLVQIIKLVRFKAPDTADHPLVARSIGALQRTLPVVPALDAGSDAWPDVMLAIVLLAVKLRRPEVFEAAARADTKTAVDIFAAREIMKKTSPEALASTQATTIGEL